MTWLLRKRAWSLRKPKNDARPGPVGFDIEYRRIQTLRKGARWIIMLMTDEGYWFPYLKPPTYAAQVKPSVPVFQSPNHAETYARRIGLIQL